MFGLASCQTAAKRGELDEWVDTYLAGGPWANAGLRGGLRQHPRHWSGPLLLPLGRLARCCGPEPGCEFPVPAKRWEARIARLAESLCRLEDVPPLIVEWRSGLLSVRDGNHRLAAMAKVGWPQCWIIVWCNSAADHKAARTELKIAPSPVFDGGI